MDSSIRILSLSRNSIRTGMLGKSTTSIADSVDSGVAHDYTHVSTQSVRFNPRLWIKVKYPPEVDDAAENGMLTSCDFDEILDRIQQSFPSWEVYFDVKRLSQYSRHALPRTVSADPPKSRISVKVKFTAWRTGIDTHFIKQAVNEVMNKTGEFSISIQTQKHQD